MVNIFLDTFVNTEFSLEAEKTIKNNKKKKHLKLFIYLYINNYLYFIYIYIYIYIYHHHRVAPPAQIANH